MKVQLDDLDERIIDLLRDDGRMSNRSIARALNVGESTIRKRLKRMEALKAMRLAVVCDVSVLQIEAFAFLRVSVAPAHSQRIAAYLAAMEETSFVAHSIGQYNIMALLTVRDKAELAAVIDERLAVLEGVHSFEIREIGDIVKHRWDIVRIT